MGTVYQNFDPVKRWELVVFNDKRGFTSLILRGGLNLGQVLWRVKRLRPRVEVAHMEVVR